MSTVRTGALVVVVVAPTDVVVVAVVAVPVDGFVVAVELSAVVVVVVPAGAVDVCVAAGSVTVIVVSEPVARFCAISVQSTDATYEPLFKNLNVAVAMPFAITVGTFAICVRPSESTITQLKPASPESSEIDAENTDAMPVVNCTGVREPIIGAVTSDDVGACVVVGVCSAVVVGGCSVFPAFVSVVVEVCDVVSVGCVVVPAAG